MNPTPIAIILLTAMGITACDRCSPSDPSEKSEVITSQSWPDDPRRIVSMAPNMTEILFELGLGDRVVAVTRYCDWPPEVADLPTIGGMLDPDFEAILAAEPDVVVGVMDGADHRVARRFESAGVDYGFVPMDDLDTVISGTEQLGRWFDAGDRAVEVIAGLQQSLDKLRVSTGHDESASPPTAILIFDHDPIVAAGPNSFGDQLLGLAGLENAVAGDLGAYPVLDAEQVLHLDPQFIVDVTIGPSHAEVLSYWRRFDTLRAVGEEAIIHIDDPVMMRPGPRIPQAVERLEDAIGEL